MDPFKWYGGECGEPLFPFRFVCAVLEVAIPIECPTVNLRQLSVDDGTEFLPASSRGQSVDDLPTLVRSGGGCSEGGRVLETLSSLSFLLEE